MSTSPQTEFSHTCHRNGHHYVLVYRRPLRKLFRKVYALRCWFCDLDVRKWG